MTVSKTRHVMAIMFALLPILLVAAAALLVIWLVRPAHSRELYQGQYAQVDTVIADWFRNLMQPDNPSVSCCGPADAYWADSFEVDGDKYVAIVTDTREDGPLGRQHIPPGTRVVVPNHKLKFDRGNPTGHGVIFLGGPQSLSVYCYVTPGGI